MSDHDPHRDDLAGENAAHTDPTDPEAATGDTGAPPPPSPPSETDDTDDTDGTDGSAAAAETDDDAGTGTSDGDAARDGAGPADADEPAETAEPASAVSEKQADEPAEPRDEDPSENNTPGTKAGKADSEKAPPTHEDGDNTDADETKNVSDGEEGSESGEPDSGEAGRKKGGRRRKVLRRTALGLVAVLLAGAAGTAWLYRDLVGGIEKKDVGGALGENRPKKLNKSLNILLIGSDSREGENAEYAVPGMSGARSDTAILLHLSPNRDRAVGVSFPRDSMVKIPDCAKEGGGTVPGRFGMLNSAFAFGGPTCTWKTLESLTGIHIDHFVQVDFAGFKRMVDALGGVEICVDRPVNDPRAELYLKAGKQTVKGDQALGYVRARYSLGDGSDLGRIERQQKFMAAVVEKATGSVLSDPAATYRFLKAATESITTDDDLDFAAMRKLADGLRGLSAGRVRFVTVPVERYAPDPNRVQWNEELAKPLFEAIRHDDELPAEPAKPAPAEQAPPPPGKVNVTVVDAGAKDDQVRRMVRQLKKRGYRVAEKVEKDAEAPESRILYAASAEGQASALARDLPDALLTADPAAPADGVRLVLGKKGARLAPPPLSKIKGGVKAGDNPCD
ncbi:MAG TPA: LCP family protein [Spirillospora sp.]